MNALGPRSLGRRLLRAPLHLQILTALILGVLLGLLLRQSPGLNTLLLTPVQTVGHLFIRLLRMVIVPLVFASIVSGVCSASDRSSLGRLSLKTFLYYGISSLTAILIGLMVTQVFQPGKGLALLNGGPGNAPPAGAPTSIWAILLRLIPENPVAALAGGDMLPLISFALILGVCITFLPAGTAGTLRRFFQALFDLMMVMTQGIIRLAPLGVTALLAHTTATLGSDLFLSLGRYALTVISGFLLHFLLVLPLLYALMTRQNPLVHYRAMLPVMLTAFTTCSSNATLPVSMGTVQEKAGVSRKISSFVLPLGATVNMNGTALYECAGVLFICQVLGWSMTFSQQVLLVLTALLSAVGTAGIPAAGVVVIFIVTRAIGLPDEQVGPIVGAMLAMDRPLDMFRTMINVFSDTVGAVGIARSEGEAVYVRND